MINPKEGQGRGQRRRRQSRRRPGRVAGRRLTEASAEQLARETLAEARRRDLIPGRTSLTSGSTHSPRVQFRVLEDVAVQAQHRARAEGRSLSELDRDALLRYLASS